MTTPPPATEPPHEPGDGPGVAVLLPAAGSGPGALERLARHLGPMAGRTLAPAFREGGRTIVGGAPDPFARAVQLTRSLLDTGAGPRLLLGHSMGGLVALKALLAGAAAEAVVLYEPITLALLAADDAADRAARASDADTIAAFRALMAAGEAEAGVARFIEAYGGAPWPRIPAAVRAELVGRAGDILAEAEATHGAPLDREGLGRLALPMLILDGDRSPEVCRRMAARLAEAVPGAHRVTLAGLGHMGPIAAPEAVAGAISAFLARHSPKDGRGERA